VVKFVKEILADVISMVEQYVTKKRIFNQVVKKNLKMFGLILLICFGLAGMMLFTDILAQEDGLWIILGLTIGFPLLGVGIIVSMGLNSIRLIRRQERHLGISFDNEMRSLNVTSIDAPKGDWFLVVGKGDRGVYPVHKRYVSRFSARKRGTSSGGRYLELTLYAVDGKQFKMNLEDDYNVKPFEKWLGIKNEYVPSGKKSHLILTLVVVSAGLIAIGYGIWQIYEGQELRQDGVQTTAEITNMRSRSRHFSGTTTLLFTANGELRHIISEISPNHDWEIGDAIEIYYLPRDPSIFRMVHAVHRRPIFEIVAIVSGVVILGFTYVRTREKTVRGKQSKEDRIARRKHIRVLKPNFVLKAYLLIVLIGGLVLALWGFISNIHHEAFAIGWQIAAGVGILLLMYILYANFCAAFNERIYLHDDHFIYRDISGNSHRIAYQKGCKRGRFLPNYKGKPTIRLFLAPSVEVEYEVASFKDIVNLEMVIKDYRSVFASGSVPSFDIGNDKDDEIIVPKAYSLKWIVITLLLTLVLIAGLWWFVHIREVPEVAVVHSDEEMTYETPGLPDDIWNFLGEVGEEISDERLVEILAGVQMLEQHQHQGIITHTIDASHMFCRSREEVIEEMNDDFIHEMTVVATILTALESQLRQATGIDLTVEAGFLFTVTGFDEAMVYFNNGVDPEDEDYIRMQMTIEFVYDGVGCSE